MNYLPPARWFICCYQRSDSEFETLSRRGIKALSMSDPQFDPLAIRRFEPLRDTVFKLTEDFDWRVTDNIVNRNSALFYQWRNLVLLGWRSNHCAVQYLSLDLLDRLSSN